MTIRRQFTKTMRIRLHPDGSSDSPSDRDTQVAGRQSARKRLDASSSMGSSIEYKKLLESIYDRVIITDLEGIIIDYNTRAAETFAPAGGTLRGGNILGLISGAGERLLFAIVENLNNEKYTLIEAQCLKNDGLTFPAEIAANKIDLDEKGSLCFLVRDITLRKKAQSDLEQAVARLEAHDRGRREFVTNVSHELRTPLTSMVYAIRNMLKGVAGPLPDKVRRYMELLDSDCKRLLATVNDILDLRKIENHSLTLSKTRVPIARLVRQSVESLRVQAEQKSQELFFRDESTHRFVDCDFQKIERMILNIVGNAVKYTPQGGRIDVCMCDDETTGYVQIAVIDNGMGIPADAISRVTVRYFTIGEQPTGSGIGLAIAKEVIDLHGGILTLKSPPPGADRGTGVYVSLPVVEAPTILVVEDEGMVAEWMQMQVEKQGYRVKCVASGSEAWDFVSQHCPDALILDLILPGMKGTELILKMRSEHRTSRIPIIVVTAAHLGVAEAEILSRYSIPVLSKPWRESELVETLIDAFIGSSALTRMSMLATGNAVAHNGA